MKLYLETNYITLHAKSKKQVFTAFDKQDDYTPDTQQILIRNQVLSLSGDGHELYGTSWNKEEHAKHEDGL